MEKISSANDLMLLKEKAKDLIRLRVRSNTPEKFAQIKVAMGTCGIAAGAKQVYNRFIEKTEQEGIEAIITQVECSEEGDSMPWAEVLLPGKDAAVFEQLTPDKVDQIVEHIIIKEERT